MSDDVVEYVVQEEEEQMNEASSVEVISDKDELQEVVQGLCEDYGEAKSARAEKERTWAKWRRQLEARPSQRTKDTPYPNASNVVPPLSQIVGQALYGHLKEMYDKVDPPWYVKPLREGDRELIEEAEVITKHFNIISKSRLDLNFSEFKRDFFNEVAVMGTCFVKVPWTTKDWHFKTYTDSIETEVNALMHDGPEVLAIPIEDIVYPENWKDIQKMPWIAHDVPKALYELQDLAQAGIYDQDAVDLIVKHAEYGSTTVRQENEDEIRGARPARDDELTLTEFYFYYDADKDGRHEDLIFTIHVPTGTVLRQGYNVFGYRMLAAGTFIDRTFMLEGRGSGQTTEFLQDEVEGIHNVRNDNMKFANMRLVAAKRGSIRENEKFYPGKIFLTDNPKEDIVPIQLGEVYPSSLQAENTTMNYAREASGMSSIMGGFADPTLGSRDTAKGQGMRLSRGQGLFASIAEGMNEVFGKIGMMIFFQLVHNKGRVIANERKSMRMTEKEIDVLEKVLSRPLEDVPLKMAFNIRTSDIDQTFEAKRQNMLSLTQLFSQYAMQTTPLAMQLFGPEGQKIQQVAPDAYAHMLSIYTGSTRMMSEVFKFFGEEDPTRYVPDIRKYEMLQDMIRNMTTQLVESSGQMQQQGQGQGPEPIGTEDIGFDEYAGVDEEEDLNGAEDPNAGGMM